MRYNNRQTPEEIQRLHSDWPQRAASAREDRETPMDTERTGPPTNPPPAHPVPLWQRADTVFGAERPPATADRGISVAADDRDDPARATVSLADGEDRDQAEADRQLRREASPQPGADAADGLSSYAVAEAEAREGQPEEPRSGRVRAVFRETLETVLLALLIFISVRAVVQNFKVEGSSMEPNLHSGQYLLVNKAAYFSIDPAALGLSSFLPEAWRQSAVTIYPFGAPSRGDVIVFRYPKDPRRDFIKRVIAVPGDTVEVRQGKVYVNGQVLHEPYIIENPAYSKELQVVPPGHFYVLGDNRNNSSDSHVWGPVPQEYIIGKAWLSYWPLSEWGLAPNYTVAAENTAGQ
jgi:signal peptidase I